MSTPQNTNPISSSHTWTPGIERRKRTQSRFTNFNELKNHYAKSLQSEHILETIRVETAVFIIRRDSTLGQIRIQLLCRLESVFESQCRGQKVPELPIITNGSEAIRPYLR